MTSVEGEDLGRPADPAVTEPDQDDPEADRAQSDDPEPDEADTDDDRGTTSADPTSDADETEPQLYERYDCTTADSATLAKAVEAARSAVERGACIVLPTDTVYGIGADAFNPDAVQGLLDAKNRGRDMPPPVLVADASLIRVLAVDVPQQAKDLVERHWPGPLTVICKVQPSLRLDLGETEGTIALRVPDHALAREVLRGTGPMAVSSANLSGQPAAVTCDEAADQLGNRVSVYLDGGPVGLGGGAPSTIVDFSQNDFGEVLRHGALSVDLLRETLPELEDLVEPDSRAEPDGPLEGADLVEPSGPSEPADPVDAVDAADPVGAEEQAEPDQQGGSHDQVEPSTMTSAGGSHAVQLPDPDRDDDEGLPDEHTAPRRQSDPEN